MNPYPPNTIDWLSWEITNGSIPISPSQIQTKKAEEMADNVQENARNFTFGCDPELVVVNDKGQPVPAEMIPGTKEVPHKVEGGAVQRDGFAAEFNIDPAKTFKEFNANIEKVIKALRTFLPGGYTLEARPAVQFAPEIFDAAPDELKMLGCTPDFNAWTGDVNPPPMDPENPYLRTFAGHLHIGWRENTEDITDPQHIMNCRDLAKQLDWWLGGWSIQRDSDPIRRRMYGKAGAIRYKPYGVEYRVLSNFWVMTRDKRLAVWNRMQFAINDMQHRFIPDVVPKNFSERLITSINDTVKDPELLALFRYPLVSTDRKIAQF